MDRQDDEIALVYRSSTKVIGEASRGLDFRNPTAAAIAGVFPATLLTGNVPAGVAIAALSSLALLGVPRLGWFWSALLGIPLAVAATLVVDVALEAFGFPAP